jgi:hypothetical protein
METTDERSSAAQPRRIRPSKGRGALSVRKRHARQEARLRIAARTREDLTPEQRADDPMMRERLSTGQRLTRALLALGGSLVVHALVVGGGVLTGGIGDRSRDPRQQEVRVEVREKKVVPLPPPIVVPEPVQKERPRPRIATGPPPPAPVPKEAPKTPPPRSRAEAVQRSPSATRGRAGPSRRRRTRRPSYRAPSRHRRRNRARRPIRSQVVFPPPV